MHVKFRKMHGLGNDFMVIDGRSNALALTVEQISRLADRHTGIGFDQLLILDKADAEGCHAAYRVFNANGTEVEQCGNGVRCIARFLGNIDGCTTNEFRLQGVAGQVSATLVNDTAVKVDMGEPDFSPEALPFDAAEVKERYALPLANAGTTVEIGAVSMGNPHAVLQVAGDLEGAPVSDQGAEISTHPRFPRQTNVEFMQILGSRNIAVRVFERGVGETSACGTGACAAVAVGRKWGLLDEAVEVQLPGGMLEIGWAGPGNSLFMSGPAVDVFGGHITL